MFSRNLTSQAVCVARYQVQHCCDAVLSHVGGPLKDLTHYLLFKGVNWKETHLKGTSATVYQKAMGCNPVAVIQQSPDASLLLSLLDHS